MKKKIVSLILVTVFLLATVSTVSAGKWVNPRTLPLYEVTGCSSNNVTDIVADGRVHIVDPQGQSNLIIQGQVRGLYPNTIYHAWVRDLTGYTGDYIKSYPTLGYFQLVTFTTDDYGNGSYQIRITADDLPDGNYYIQVAINDNTSGNGCTVLATQYTQEVPGTLISVSSNK